LGSFSLASTRFYLCPLFFCCIIGQQRAASIRKKNENASPTSPSPVQEPLSPSPSSTPSRVPPMARRGSIDGGYDEELALRAADELLTQDDEREHRASLSSLNSSRRRSSAGSLPAFTATRGGSGRALLTAYGVAVALSALSSRQLAQLDRHSKLATLAFPLTHFGALGLLAVAIGVAKPRSSFGAAGAVGAEAGGRVAWGAGAAAALGMVLRLWEVRMGDERVCEALEVRRVHLSRHFARFFLRRHADYRS
jgi:hypothetical protein